jgi:hypothetical protein
MIQDILVIATVVYPSRTSETNARLLIESLRAFGGSLSKAPIWCLVPESGKEVTSEFRDLCNAKKSELLRFEISSETARFPLAADVAGAAFAEHRARNAFHLLAWLGANTLVFQEPRHFLLPDRALIGYCPVHHTNIGSGIDAPLDAFWSCIYEVCKVPQNRVFSMNTQVDGKILRPYFNATSLVNRPERGLFIAWKNVFFEVFQQKEFSPFYEQNEKYAIFMHQAVLSGLILAMISKEEMALLPTTYNYPLHLWRKDVTDARPRTLNELVTARHEGFYLDANWRDAMPEGDTLKKWLSDHIP